jgi:hypothetical protein
VQIARHFGGGVHVDTERPAQVLNRSIAAEIERLKTFSESIVLPTYEQIKDSLEAEGHQVTIDALSPSISKTESPFSALIEKKFRMSGVPPLWEYSSTSSHSQWLLGSVKVALKDIASSGRPYANQFCLGLEGHIQENGEIYGIASTYWIGNGEEVERFEENLMEGSEIQDIANISELDILAHFVSSYGAFRANRQTHILENAPERLKANPVPIVKETPHQSQEATPTKPAVTDQISDVLEQQRIIQAQKAALAEVEKVEQNKAQGFLNSHNLHNPIFRHLSPYDQTRLSTLADALSSQRPQAAGERQTAFDWSIAQASEFAFSLNPISGAEFADYLEVYRTMLDNDCRSRLKHESSKTYESIWIEQVKAYGEINAPDRVRKEESQKYRLMVQGVMQRLGKPDEFGQREWVGAIAIEPNLPPDQMIRMIKMRSEQRQIRFEHLSYAILELYRNAVHLPESERNLSSSIVRSYLQSLKLTIAEARSSEVELQILENICEFRFCRVISNGAEKVRAVAQVRVMQPFGEMVLCSYEFKQS